MEIFVGLQDTILDELHGEGMSHHRSSQSSSLTSSSFYSLAQPLAVGGAAISKPIRFLLGRCSRRQLVDRRVRLYNFSVTHAWGEGPDRK
jgi:hypothetical protein